MGLHIVGAYVLWVGIGFVLIQKQEQEEFVGTAETTLQGKTRSTST